MRRRAACTASASAWSTRCRSTRSSRSRATSSSTARPSPAALPTSQLVEIGADPEPARHHHRLHPRSARFSARTRSSSRRGSTGWRAPRPICSPASRYAGAAIPSSISDETPAEAVFQFPGGLADHLKEQIGDARDRDQHRPSPAGRISRTARARSNGRWPGRSGATATPLIIATPSRPPTAAPTSRACARR